MDRTAPFSLVNVAKAFSALLVYASELGARKALDSVQREPPSRRIPNRECVLGYRATLCPIAAPYGREHKRSINREELDDWTLAHPITNSSQYITDSDEIDASINSNRQRRAHHKGAK